MKIVPLFLKAGRDVGGLGLTEQEIGIYYGTFGAAAFVLGSLLGGYYISARGLKKTLFSLCCVFNLPFMAYTLLAIFQPQSAPLIGGAIVLEYFGYGFGFVGLTLFMMQQVAAGPHQMAHYAFASGIMNLGVMLPGMMSGYVSDWLYENYGIAVRSGAHCAPLMHEALGTREQGAVRFSFSHVLTEEEVRIAAQALREFAEEEMQQ